MASPRGRPRCSHDNFTGIQRFASEHSHHRLSYAAPESIPETQDTTLDPGHPRAWKSPVFAFSGRVYRQLLGLNPFKTTYLSLYDSLDSPLDQAVAWTGALFAIAAGVPLPIIGYIFGQIINEFPPDEQQILHRIQQLLGVAVAYFAVTATYLICFGLTSEKISTRLRKRLLDCLLHLDQAYLDTHDIDVNSLLSEKMDTIQAGCSEKVGICIQSISYFVAAFTVGFILNAKLTGILLASIVPAITLTFVFLSPAISRYSRAGSKQSEQANEVVETSLSSLRIVQAFDIVAELCRRHAAFLEQSTHSNVKKSVAAALQAGFVYFIAYAANGLAFYLGSRMADGGNAGTVYAVVFLILDASFVVGSFAPFLEIFARAASAKGIVQDLFEARDSPGNIGSHRRTGYRPDLRELSVRFESVTFSYPARPTVKVLNDVNLSFGPDFHAVVGTSGGGKSTLVALLLGIYEHGGTVRFNGEDARKIDSSYLRSQIAVLDQEAFLFSGTIYENICHGLVDQGHDLSEGERSSRCERALQEAAVDFLDDLPKGVHTRIGNELQLSGGQKQRICLARALIKQPALLLLDEPTSALDAHSELLVMQAVKKIAAAGTMVIMVAHRLSTVIDADNVIVMSEGKVIEQGAPQDLSDRGRVFRSLLDAQKTTFDSRRESLSTDAMLTKKADTRTIDTLTRDQEDNPDIYNTAQPLGVNKLLGRVARTAGPDAWVASLGLLASVVSGGLLLGEALVFGNLVQLLNTSSGTTTYESQADFFCLIFFILACVALVSYVASGSAFGVTSARFTARLQAGMLRRLLHLDIQWFQDPGHSVHELMSAFTKDPGDLSCLSGVALGTIFTISTSVFGGIILAHIVAWKIAIVLLSAVPLMIVAGYTRLRILTVSEARHREAYKTATGLAAESCRNRRAVTALSLEPHLLSEFGDALAKPYKESRRFTVYSNTLLAFCFAITYFVYALAYWWGSRNVRNGTYTTKQFFTVLPALLFSAQAAGQLFSLSPEIARAKTAARSIFNLLDAQSQIMLIDDGVASDTSSVSTKLSTEKSPTLTPAHNIPKLQFDHVSLAYSGNTARHSLCDVSLAIEAGQTVAFVGPSGAGKSSMISLVERFFDPSSGALLFEGIDVRHLNVRILRGCMALVSQQPDLFGGSIAYNVKLGARPGSSVTDEDVERVCTSCGLHEFITSLPEGYNTECGSSGSQLSGGQKQRLAIARALTRDPEILLLDEPTSALDAHSESVVQATLAKAAEGRTTIIVAHRLSSIKHVDRIYVFDEGRVVASGTHQKLVEEGGLYASMAQAQSLT